MSSLQRQPREIEYGDGHAVALIALLNRVGGEVTLTAAELAAASGVIRYSLNDNGSATYRVVMACGVHIGCANPVERQVLVLAVDGKGSVVAWACAEHAATWRRREVTDGRS